MGKFVKIFLGAVGVVVLLAIVAIAIFAFTFDADDYKATVQTLVKKQTGRDLVIEGDLTVSYFPWLGFEVGPTRLSDGAGYGDDPFARFQGASARVKIMPLLSKRIEIGALTLDGLNLKLVRNANGSANWDDLAGGSGQTAATPSEPGDGSLDALRIGGVRLTDANVSFTDGSAGATYTLSDWDLVTGELTPGKPFELTSELAFSASEPALTGTLNAAGTLTTDIDAGRFTLDGPKINVTVSGKTLPASTIIVELDGASLTAEGESVVANNTDLNVRLSGGADLPVDTLTVDIATPRLTVNGTDVTIDAPVIAFDGDGTGDKPLHKLKGTLNTASIDVTGGDAYKLPTTTLAATASGPALPGDKGADVKLTLAGISGSVERGVVTISNAVFDGLGLSVKVPEVAGSSLNKTPTFAGTFSIAEFSPRTTARELAIDLPPTSDESVLTKMSGAAGFSAGTDSVRLKDLRLTLDQTRLTGSLSIDSFETLATRFNLNLDSINVDRYLPPPEEPDEARPVDAIEIPSEQIRDLDAEGTLTIGKLVFAGIQSTDVTVGLKAKNGSARVFPSKASLYGGTYTGDIRIDASGAKPRMSMNEKLTGVQFGALTQDLLQTDKLTGAVNGSVTLEAFGDEITELRQTLNGTAQFNFIDGAYEGVDLWHEISRAVALVKQQPVPSGPGKARTEFSQMSGSATVTNGIMRSDDLDVALPFMRVGGEGIIDLVQQQIDYNLKATVIKSPALTEEAETLAGRTVPISITGNLSDPKVRPDVKTMLADAVKDKVKEKIEDKLGDLLGGALGKKKDDEPTTATTGTAATDSASDTAGAQAPKKQRPEDLLRGLLGGGTEAPAPGDEPLPEGEPEEAPQEEKRPEDLLKDLLGGD